DKPSYGQHEFAPDARRGKWLAIASGVAGVEAPIALGQDAVVRVAKLTGTPLEVQLGPERYGFLFVADGTARINGSALETGDAVRLRGPQRFDVEGDAELVFWDVPPTNVRLEDA